MKGLAMIVCIISVCGIISELWLWRTCRVVCRNKDAALEFSVAKLHRMPWRIGVAAPVFLKLVGGVYLWLIGAVDLHRDIDRLRPGRAIVSRADIPHFPQAITLPYFALMIVSCIVEEEYSALWVSGVGKIYHRGRVASLEGVVVYDRLHAAPGFSVVAAALHDKVDVTEVASMVDPPFAECEKVTSRQADDGGYPVALMPVCSGNKDRGRRLCKGWLKGTKEKCCKNGQDD